MHQGSPARTIHLPVPLPLSHSLTDCFQISTESETNLGSNLKRVSLPPPGRSRLAGRTDGRSRSEYKMERVDIMHETGIEPKWEMPDKEKKEVSST